MAKKITYLIVLLLIINNFVFGEHVPQQLIIKSKKTIKTQAHLINGVMISPVLNNYKLKKIEPLFKLKNNSHIIGSSLKNNSDPFNNIYLIEISNTINVHEVVKSFKQDTDIVWAQPNYIYKTVSIPNDPFYQSHQWNLPLINMEETWDITLGSEDVAVAVVDTGVDWHHEDLVNNIWQNSDETINGIDDDGNGFIDDVRGWDFVDINPNAAAFSEDYSVPDNDPSDMAGHGTHVSGIIAAEINNNKGVVGVAPNVKIMPLRAGFLDSDGDGSFYTNHICYSIKYAANNNAKVINLSLGNPIKENGEDDLLMKEAINYAFGKGCVVVAASGNGGRYSTNSINLDLTYYMPAEIPGVITVGAIDNNSEITYYSNFGSAVDVVAPGGAGDGESPDIASTYPNNTYIAEPGTSMATPHVAGLAALLISMDPTISSQDVYNIITETATDTGSVGYDPYYGYGIINPLAAILSIDTEVPIATFSPTPTANIGSTITITINVTDDLYSTKYPIVTINYRFYVDSIAEGSWQKIKLTKTSNLYTANINAQSSIKDMHYYFEIADSIPSHQFTLPQSTPEINPYILPIRDTSGPEITFPVVNNDYFSQNQNLDIVLTDNTAIDSDSIDVDITTQAGTTTYDINNSAISYSGNILSINLALIDINIDGETVIKVTVSDAKNNTTSQQISIQKTTSLKLFGPNGENSAILNASNPFNPETDGNTKICFQVSQDSEVSIYIYSLGLKLVHKIEQTVFAGYHDEIIWNGRDEDNDMVSNGVYILIIKAEADGKTVIKRNKIAVLK